MKTFRFIPAVVVSAGLLFNSCIREEAPNMEADIESVTIARKPVTNRPCDRE